jgi:pimeloyl-ACP methyl ester carboxylesterase
MWTSQIPSLAASGYQCITFDQRGFARSDVPRTGYDFDTLADDLRGLIEELDLVRFSPVAFSLGAAVLARYLSRHGARGIDKSVLVSPITPYVLWSDDNLDGLDRAVAYEPFRAGLIQNRPQLLHDSLDAFFSPTTAEQPISEALREWIVTSALRSPLMPMLEYFRTSSETDFLPDMRSFTMPTLIVHGELDVFAPPAATGLRTHHMIRGSEFIGYAGASHGLLFSHSDRFNRDVANFIGVGVA